jgi:hypothetical protein
LAALLLGLLVAFLGFSSAKADASPGQVTQMDATGAVFACNDGSSYTVTSGSVTFVLHESTDAAGGQHFTGTIAPGGDVRLSYSGGGGTYRLAGASWFGGNLTAGGTTEFADTAHFVILGSNGPVANVSATFVGVVNANGVVTATVEKNTGTCQEPEE